jgi:hypothetical protein
MLHLSFFLEYYKPKRVQSSMYVEAGWEGGGRGKKILAEVGTFDRIPIFRLTTMKSPISSLIFSSSSSSSSSSLLSSAPLFLLLFFLSPSS